MRGERLKRSVLLAGGKLEAEARQLKDYCIPGLTLGRGFDIR
jgi:hypothetical protein